MSVLLNGYETFAPMINDLYEESQETLDAIDENTFSRRKDTRIMDCNGELIAEINVTNYQYVPINSISPYVYNAYIAVEDKTFKEHDGLDYKALCRAALSLAKNHGHITQGGSTITQQVIKNNLIHDKSKFQRKIMEFMMVGEVEELLTKDQIMEAYCNTNYFANNCYGIETASLYYYGKHAKDLTLGESATLAGISNLPAKYDPKEHPDNALSRRNHILDLMLEQEMISTDEYFKAKAEIPVYVFEKDSRTEEDYMTSYAIHCATELLMEKEGFEFQYTFKTKEEETEYRDRYTHLYTMLSSDIRLGGYEIYTSLDPVCQEKLQALVDEPLSVSQEKGEDGFYELQGAAVAVDNATGYVIAIVGGRTGSGEFNRGYQAIRQPGSAIKPLLVYTPAFETGRYYPSKVLCDKEIPKGPRNAYRGYKGNMPLQEALARSTNTIAYQTFLDIGVDYGTEFLEKMKFSHLSYLDYMNGSMSLGGFTNGVSVDQMAKGYATLANHGIYYDNTCIRKINFRNSGTQYESSSSGTQVYLPDTAYMMLQCMEDVLSKPYGTGHARQVNNAIVAAKTGTTNEGKDVWFCGSSAYYSMAVWVGYDQPRANAGLSGRRYPGYTFQKYMEYLHEDKPMIEFERPETVVTANINGRGDPVNYFSFRKGIFSQQVAMKLEDEKNAEAAAIKKEKEDQLKRNIDQSLDIIDTMKLFSHRDIPRVEMELANCEAMINQLSTELDRQHYTKLFEASKEKVFDQIGFRYQPGTIFFIPDGAIDQARNTLLDEFHSIKENRARQELRNMIENQLDILSGIHEITLGTLDQIDMLFEDIEAQLTHASNEIDTSAYWTRFEEEKERLRILMDPTQENETGNNEEVYPNAPEVTPAPGWGHGSEVDKVIDAQQLIQFLRTIYPGDAMIGAHLQSAVDAVEKCRGMMEYDSLKSALEAEAGRLLN